MKQLAFLVAVAFAFVVARPLPPQVTMPNQLIAIFGWGLVMMLAPAPAVQRSTWRAAAPLLAVFGIVGAACLASIVGGGMPSPPGNGVLGIIALAAAVTLHGTSAGQADPVGMFRRFAIALVVAGLCGAVIAVLQIYVPQRLDNVIVAYSSIPGRATGNIGQANQFADSMLWGLIALAPLAQGARTRLARVAWAPAGVFMLFGIVLTGSRTALVALVLMAAWGVFDRKLDKRLRLGLALSPIVAGVLLAAVSAWSSAHGQGGLTPIDRGDAGVTAYRGEIWSNAVALIRQQPWLGVGWGQFNFAWSLTPFADRSAGLVDNTHDLPLQLAVELGVPLAVVVMLLLVGALGVALVRVWRVSGEVGAVARAGVMIVIVIGLHSMLEYPLWYSYMLLPATWAFGVALGAAGRLWAHATPAVDDAPPSAAPVSTAPLRAWRALGLMMMVLAGSAWLDYLNIVSLYLPRQDSAPFDDRIASGQTSPLFSNLADYVQITQHPGAPGSLPMVQRTSRVLVNSRLLFTWSNMLAAQGEMDKARYLAARMREFKLAGAMNWFDVCSDPAVATKPFQCLAPEHPVTWRDFR